MSDRPPPLVFVHGLMGFGRIGNDCIGMDYFRSIPNALRAAGHHVPPPPSLPPTGPIAQRAAALRDWLDAEPATRDRRVHLIAHSMGGLDARYLISRLNMADRVISLTTIGTPHRGTPLADVGTARLRAAIVLLEKFKVPTGAFDDLTVERCHRFNDDTRDAPGVRYYSIAGKIRVKQFPPSSLLATYYLMRDSARPTETDNDGMVPVESARWGERFTLWPGLDHVHLINWGNFALPQMPVPEDVVQKYLDLARSLPTQ